MRGDGLRLGKRKHFISKEQSGGGTAAQGSVPEPWMGH